MGLRFQCFSVAEVAAIREEVVRASQGGPEPLLSSDGLRSGGVILADTLLRAREGPMYGPDSIHLRLAFLVRGIVQEHAYVNGNKRTGLAVLAATMGLNGLQVPENERLELFLERIATAGSDLEEIRAWIQANATHKSRQG